MKKSLLFVFILSVFVFASGAFNSVLGCPNCYGDPESSMTSGMNMAIVSLLGVTGGVLAAFVAFFVYLRKRINGISERFANHLN